MVNTLLIRLLYIGIFLLAYVTVFPKNSAQHCCIEPFAERNHLSNNTIYSIAQDTTGFLWIGTSYGLNKYDGNKITQYYFDPDDPSSIGDNYIQKIFIDSEGNIWVLVPQYFCKYDEEKDSFVRFAYAKEKKNTHTSNPGDIIEDYQGNIWIGTPEMGMYLFNKQTGTISELEIPFVNTLDIQFVDNDTVWISSVGEIGKYIISTGETFIYQLPIYDQVIGIDFSANLVVTSGQFYKMNFAENDKISFTLSPTSLISDKYRKKCILETDRHLWVGTKGEGLIMLSKNDKKTVSFKYEKNSPNTISNNSINVLYEDRSGVLWIGTNDGLNRCIFKHNRFNSILQEDQKNGLISNIINSIFEDDKKNLWISTFEGVSKLDLRNGEFTNYTSIEVNEGERKDLENTRTIIQDKSGNIWLAKKQGLYMYDKRNGQFCFCPLPTNDGTDPDVLCAYTGSDSCIWVGTYGNGIYQIDPVNGSIISNFTVENSQLSSNYIKDIIQLENGDFCFATLRTGIDLYDSRNNEFKNLKFDRLTNSYVSNFINNVYQDSRGDLWVLSWHGGFVLDKNFQLKHQFTTSEGIASNELTAISEDAHNDIWLGSANGISRISFFTDSYFLISNYTTDEGLSSNNISTGGIISSSDQSVYIGTSNGIIYFNLDDVPINLTSAVPEITGFRIFNNEIKPGQAINGQVVLDKQIHLSDEIHLNYKQKTITIEFSTLDFSQNRNRHYAYKLEGLDKDWIHTKNQINAASYSNLYRGKYIFRVKSQNANGIWSEERILSILVTPPFWVTWWAFLLYFIFLIAIIYFTIRFFLYQDRLKQELKIRQIRNEKENEINKIKLRFYTNISHDIRTPLTLIIGPIEHILKYESIREPLKKQIVVIRDNASYLLSLINQLLDFRKMETEKSALKASEHDIVTFARNITEAFTPYARQRNVDLQFISDINEEFLWFDPELMKKVFYNLISNALKFTYENGKVTVSISSEQDEVLIKIIDTGIGINPGEESKIFEDFYQVNNNSGSILNNYTSGSGIGLSIVKKYVEVHKGYINVISIPGKGSTFFFKLKKGYAHFDEIQLDHQKYQYVNINIPRFELNPENKPVEYHPQKKNNDTEAEQNTILIVDDNPDLLQFISLCLQDRFNLLTATNGKEALAISEKSLPDIIISDIMMPEMDGFEFAKKLKENKLTNHIPILFLTAKASLEDTLKGLKIGACDYITKPFNETILLSKLENLIADRNQLQAFLKKQYLENSLLEINTEKIPEDKSIQEITDPFMQKVVDFIQKNIENIDLTSELIEQHLKVSKMQLYRKLKAVSGLSVSDVIRKIRFRKACELLEKSDRNISEIAYDLGFSDPFYFSKAFKKETGYSPLQYRKKKHGNEA